MNNENMNAINETENYSNNDILIKEKEEFQLTKNSIKYTFLIIKFEAKIIIKNKNYFVNLIKMTLIIYSGFKLIQ